MKYNINVFKSVWRRVRKPSRATLNVMCSQDAGYVEGTDKTDVAAEQEDALDEAAKEAKRKAQTVSSDVGQYIARLEAERDEMLALLKRIEGVTDKPAFGVQKVTFAVELMTAVHAAAAKTENAQARGVIQHQ
jgi:hypothetical protein